MDKLYYIGIDVGSTTVKLYVEDQEHQCIYFKISKRHYSDVKPAIESLIKSSKNTMGNLPVKVVMAGSRWFIFIKTFKCRICSRSDCLYKNSGNLYS